MIDFLTQGMPIELWGLILILVLVFLAGFVDAIAGGGGLISLPAYLIAGVPVRVAIGTNKLSAVMGTTVATAKYIKEGYVIWPLAIPCAIVAFLGSSLGAESLMYSNDTFLRIFMLAVIPVAGYAVLKKKTFFEHRENFSKAKTMAMCMFVAFAMGFYDGFYGPGTGTFCMILFAGLIRLNVRHSAGMTKIVNLTTNVAATIVLLLNDVVIIPLGIVAGLFNIAGNYLGARTFTEKGISVVRPIIITVLIIFAIRLIGEFIGWW